MIYTWLAGKVGWLAVIGALLAALMFQQVRVSNARAGADRARAELADTKTRYAQAAQVAENAARQEEARREADKLTEVANAHQERDRAAAAARTADAAAVGVRKQLAAYIAAVRGATSDSGAAGRGSRKQGADPLDLLADLYGGADQAAGEIARYAGELAIAGGTCERLADRLQPAGR